MKQEVLDNGLDCNYCGATKADFHQASFFRAVYTVVTRSIWIMMGLVLIGMGFAGPFIKNTSGNKMWWIFLFAWPVGCLFVLVAGMQLKTAIKYLRSR
jgi:hypothetical protein